MKFFAFFKKAIWIVFIPLIGLIYKHLDHNNGHVHSLVTTLDHMIPFSPYFVVPYLAWYGLILFGLLWFLYQDEKIYYCALVSIIMGLLVSFFIFFVFQTTVARPAIQDNGIFAQLVKAVYLRDNPYNAFPSIHVLTSYIIFRGGKETKLCSPNTSIALQSMCILVILSTLFLKQHALLDVAGGIFFGQILFSIVEHLFSVLFDTGKNMEAYEFTKHKPIL